MPPWSIVDLARVENAGINASPARQHRAPVPHRGFIAQRDGAAPACGQYVVENDIVGLYDVFTVPVSSRRGLARELRRALLLRARDEGARSACLQVESDNHAARTAKRGLGCADGYAYRYRPRDPEAA